jgi:multicomponent Na+:H+ antiporter subunit D
MPGLIWCYTFCSLALIGIPPTGGFLSKWYLATGALSSEIPVFKYLGPVILLISALLTAGYLLPLSIDAFFGNAPGTEGCEGLNGAGEQCLHKPGKLMLVPILILTVLAVLLGFLTRVPDIFFNEVFHGIGGMNL